MVFNDSLASELPVFGAENSIRDSKRFVRGYVTSYVSRYIDLSIVISSFKFFYRILFFDNFLLKTTLIKKKKEIYTLKARSKWSRKKIIFYRAVEEGREKGERVLRRKT